MRIAKVLFLVFLAIGLSSCGGQKREKSVKLIWWGTLYNRNFASKLVEAYNKTNPATKVSLIAPTGNYWMKLQTMMAGGTAPDVLLFSPTQAYELANKGALLSLNDHRTDPAYISFQENVWKALKDELIYKGNLYAIPIWTNTIGIFYNKGLFDKAGVAYPTKDWTFNDLLEKAKLLTIRGKNGRIEQYGFGGFPLSVTPWNLDMLIKSFGGELYSKDMRRCLIDTPESIAAVKWAVELVNKYHVAPSPSELSASKGVVSASGTDLFQMGKVAMVYWGRWYLAMLSKRPDLKWAVAPYPRGKRKIMYQAPIYLGISSTTKFPDASWKFIKFVMSKAGQKMLVTYRTEIPVLRSVANMPAFLNYAGREDATRVFLGMLEYAEIPHYLPGKGEWVEFAKMKLELALLGKISVEEACKEIAKNYEQSTVNE